MKNTFSFITPFPDVINSYISSSIMKKANEKGIVDYNILNLFEYGNSPHYKIDDYPFGGAKGMVLKPEPLSKVINELRDCKINQRIIFPTPDGELYNHKKAKILSYNSETKRYVIQFKYENEMKQLALKKDNIVLCIPGDDNL